MTETGDQSYDALYTGAQLGKHLAALARKAGKYTSIKLDGNALYGVHFQAIESGEIILPAQDVANFAEAVELRGQHTQTESYLAIATFLEDWTRSGVRATESSVAQPSPDSANDESELNEDDKREEETMIVGTEDGSTSNDLHVIDESVLEAGQQPAKAALGERLRAMADLLGTTYSKVNEAAGRPNLLSLLPNGNGSIGVEHLRALAAYFDVSVAFLFKSGNPTLEELQNERRRVSFEEDTSDADQQAPDQHDTGHGVSIINEAGDGVAQSGHVPTDADATGGDNEDAVVETVQSSAADDQGDAEEQVCKADDDIMYRDLFFRLARGQGDSLASRLLELLQRSSAGESIDWRAEVFGISDKLISLSEQISQLQASDPDLFEEVAEMTIREFASISSS